MVTICVSQTAVESAHGRELSEEGRLNKMLIFTDVRVAMPGFWKDRWFTLDTNELDSVQKHRIEFLVESQGLNSKTFREWRSLFHQSDEPMSVDRLNECMDHIQCFSIDDDRYCEDDEGNGLSLQQGLRIVTQDDALIVFPPATRPHDVALRIGDNCPVPEDPLAFFQFKQSEVNGLALFLRDIKELRQNPFYERHATMRSVGDELTLETISVDLIRSFITIFRRLYMSGKHDVGNFRDSCDVYCSRFWNKRVIDWVAEERRLYDEFLQAPAAKIASTQPVFSFSNKRLIDVFLYTRFAHHPSEERTRQLKQMRNEVGSDEWLEFMFYEVIQQAAIIYSNVSQYIAFEMDGYWKVGGLQPSADTTPFCNGGDRGVLLTAKEEAEERIRKRAEKLGEDLWNNAGCPANELPRFVQDAVRQLSDS